MPRFIGSKHKKNEKMEATIAINGSSLIATKEIGKTTSKMVLEFSFTKMVTNTKVNGQIIAETDSAHIGSKTTKKNLYEVLLADILMIKSTEKEPCFLIMEIDMTGIGKKMKSLDLGE